MQPEQIETFLDLCQTRSFNRTAERLGVTQSTVSGRVAALEEALDVRLFDRSRAGTALTPEGQRFRPHALRLRQEWHEARRRIRVPAHATEAVRLGMETDLAALCTGDWTAGLRRAFPQLALDLMAQGSARLCADLLAGELDFALAYTPAPHPELTVEPLGEVALVMVSTLGPDLSAQRPEAFILAAISPEAEVAQRHALPDLAATPLRANLSGAVAAMLAGVGGAAFLPERAAAPLLATGAVVRVTDAPVLRQQVHAAWPRRHDGAGLHRRLLRISRRMLAGG